MRFVSVENKPNEKKKKKHIKIIKLQYRFTLKVHKIYELVSDLCGYPWSCIQTISTFKPINKNV